MTYFDLPSCKSVLVTATTPLSDGMAEITPFLVVVAFVALSVQFGFLKRKETTNIVETPITTPSISIAGFQKGVANSTSLNAAPLPDVPEAPISTHSIAGFPKSGVNSTILNEEPSLDKVLKTTTDEETLPNPEVKFTSKKLD